jgi:hypothetical protein
MMIPHGSGMRPRGFWINNVSSFKFLHIQYSIVFQVKLCPVPKSSLNNVFYLASGLIKNGPIGKSFNTA